MVTFLLVAAWIWGYCLIGTMVGVIGYSVGRRVGMDGSDAGFTAGLTGPFWPVGVWVLAAMFFVHQSELRRDRRHLAALQRDREDRERAKLVELSRREIETWSAEHPGFLGRDD